jgi:hypothetical protein
MRTENEPETLRDGECPFVVAQGSQLTECRFRTRRTLTGK